MIRKPAANGALISMAATLLLMTTAIACSKKTLDPSAVGSVNVALTLPGGGIVDTVTYAITGNGLTVPISGSIDVSAPGTTQATALVSGLAAGSYVVTMTALVNNGANCGGSTPFTIVPGQTALAMVILQCSEIPPTGTVAIRGTLDQCPYITGLSATSLQAQVGGSIAVSVSATDLDGQAITYAWTSSVPAVGALTPPNAATALFTCFAIGTTQLSIMVSDGVCGGTIVNAIPISCVSSGAGLGTGTGGTMGGTGAGGAGSSAMSCLETNPPPALATACMACLATYATPTLDGCCGIRTSDPTGYLLCQAASSCMRAGGPPVGVCNVAGDTSTCLCGTNIATCDFQGQPNGPCLAPLTAAAGRNVLTMTTDAPTQSQVISRFGDSMFAIGRATSIQLFAGAFCAAECGYLPGGAGASGTGGTGGSGGASGAAGRGGSGGAAGRGGSGGVGGRGGSGGFAGTTGTGGGVCPPETNPPPAFAASCTMCLAPYQTPMDGCCGIALSDPTGYLLCQSASACMRAGGPPVGVCNMGGDTGTCYCGTNAATCDVPGQANGPCVAQITAAAGRNVVTMTTDAPTPLQVLTRFGDTTFAIGRAETIQTYAGAFCPDECGYVTGAAGTGGTGGTAGTGGASGAAGRGGSGGGAAGRGGSGGAAGVGGTSGTGGAACVETNPPPAIAATCQACISQFTTATEGCCTLTTSDPTGAALCTAASDCMRAGGPPVGVCNFGGDTGTCYCGTAITTCDQIGQPNGPCVAQITAAAGRNVVNGTTDMPTPAQVLVRFGDEAYAIGRAASVQTYAAAFCWVECGY